MAPTLRTLLKIDSLTLMKDLLEEVEAFEGEEEKENVMEEIHRYQSDKGDLPTESNPHRSSTDEGPSTNITHFVCSN